MTTKKATPYLGILATPTTRTPPFPEQSYYAYLSQAGRKIGLPVYVVLPNKIDFQSKTVIGYHYTNKKWELKRLPLPSLVYDRVSNRKKYLPAIRTLKSIPSITFLGHVLGDKLRNHNHLIQHSGIATFMPPTELITSIQVVKHMLDSHDAIIIKPMQNSLGIGVMKLTSKKDTHRAEGRDFQNKIFRRTFPNRAALLMWVRSQLKVKMIIQPYLTLSSPEGVPFDIRVLVQKNESGQWSETGRAARAGVPNGLTSNLCGGGRAHSVPEFLGKYYNNEQLAQIERDISYIARELPPFLESRHGRLVELGIDVGVDRNGKVWLIEVNSKPGRASFRRIENGAYYRSVRLNPLKYAYYLKSHKGTGS